MPMNFPYSAADIQEKEKECFFFPIPQYVSVRFVISRIDPICLQKQAWVKWIKYMITLYESSGGDTFKSTRLVDTD